MAQSFTVIGLCGRAGVGKNWIASHIFSPLGFREVALADHFKVEAVGVGRFSFEQVFHTKPKDARTYLQQRGTEQGRAFDEDIWTRHLTAWLQLWNERWGFTRYVVTDLRFPNEVAWVRGLKGLVLAVRSDRAATLTPEQLQHPSEAAVEEAARTADGYVWNDKGMSEEEIRNQVIACLALYGVQ